MDERPGFHVVIRPWRILIGLAAGLAYLLLLQQYGVTTFTTLKLIIYMVVGAAVAVALPTLATLIPHRTRADPDEAKPEGGAP
jgi:MFS superfamily sulfate permease-like transporter